MWSQRYTDLYGNPCRRATIAAGRSVLRFAAVATVPDAPEEVSEAAAAPR